MKKVNYNVGEKVYVKSQCKCLHSGSVTINKIIDDFAYSDDLPDDMQIDMRNNWVVGLDFDSDIDFGLVFQTKTDSDNDTEKPLLAYIIKEYVMDDNIRYEVLREIADVLEKHGYECKI